MKTQNFFKSLLMCMLLCSMSLGFVSCSDDDDNRRIPIQDKTCKDFLIQDYLKAVNKYPEFIGHFMEAQYELTGKVSDLPLKDLKPVSVHYVLYYVDRVEHEGEYGSVPYLLEQDRNFTNGRKSELVKTKVNSPWVFDSVIQNFDHFISLEEVIKIIKNSEYADFAQTRFITLRAPVISGELFPQRESAAQYVFGGISDRDEHIFVDAVTGAIAVLEK